jgi:molybdate transport system permease protein
MGRSLGSGPTAVFRRVAVPLAWRGILAGTLLAFARALGEFGATIMVAGSIPGRTQTLALAIFQRTQIGQEGAALRLVAVTVVVAFAAVWTTEILTRRRTQRTAA